LVWKIILLPTVTAGQTVTTQILQTHPKIIVMSHILELPGYGKEQQAQAGTRQATGTTGKYPLLPLM